MIRTQQACCFTGHREISDRDLIQLPGRLDSQTRALIEEGIVDFITGGARGFDTLAALSVLRLRREFPQIRLILALPCREQTKGWRQTEKQCYDEILKLADWVHYSSDSYDRGCMMRRNRFMVDHSVCCVFYLKNRRSGTYKTVQYAMEQELRLCNILL